MERVESLSEPGAEEAGECHASRAAFGTTGSPADFASDDQRANTAFGQVIVGGDPRIGDEDKEFGQKAFDPFTERLHGSLGLDKRRTDLPEFLLKGMLQRHP